MKSLLSLKNKMLTKKNLVIGWSVVGISLFASPAMADWVALSGAVDFSGVITAIFAIAATLFAVYIVIKGVRMVMGLVR